MLTTKEDNKMETYEYIELANTCENYDDAQRLIELAADDQRLSDRQYEYIRHLAIRSAYKNS